MDSEAERVIKSTQEQAVASWVTYLNQVRLDELINTLNEQDGNLAAALGELAELKSFIGDSSHILGSAATKHGEIAEHVQVNFSNARNLIDGLEKDYTFEGVGRTAPEDYLYKGNQIQSKFYSGTKNTLEAVQKHLETYPDFVSGGGAYDIPKDQYDEIKRVLELEHQNPSALSKADRRLLEAVKEFQKNTGLDFEKDVKPAVAGYSDVQQGKINKTIDDEESNIRKKDKENRRDAYEKSKPSVNEGLKVAGISAGVESGVTFCTEIAKKRREGKSLHEFTEQDWKEIGIETGKSGIKGGIRGGSIYVLTNFTATPANVASAYVTAAFGVVAQAKAYEAGTISKEDFLINSEAVCLDVTVSAIASLVGQAVIPIPILGAVIGNVAGEFIYGLCKQNAGRKEQQLAAEYQRQIAELNQALDIQYINVVLEIQKALKKFADVEKLAFDEDVNRAFSGSVRLALEVGVEESRILKSQSEIDNFFLN